MNWESEAQREQYLAVCRHTYNNIIFNYGSIKNYIASKGLEIEILQSKLQSYYDNRSKGKSRRVAIISGLENRIFLTKNGLLITLEEIELLEKEKQENELGNE